MTGPQASLLQHWGRKLGIEVDDQAIARLGAYASLLDVWNRRIRLTGERDTGVLIEKHLPDCLAVAGLVRAAMRVADVGSGPGLPGAVIAAVDPGVSVTLIESRRRPASFLREVARSVPLPNVEVVEDRWELWAGRHPRSLDLVTGRAIRLEVLLEPAATVLAPGGRVVGMQSQRVGGHELSDVAARYGLGLVETRAYELPSGEPRQLVVFGRP